MKSNLKFDNKNFVAEVSISNMMEEDEMDMHDQYMNECMTNDAAFVDTAGMCSSDAKYMCGMSYMKNRPMLSEMAGQLTEKQKTLPPAIQKAILKRMHKKGNLNESGMKEAEASGCWDSEMKAEPTAVFPQKPAPSTGEINPHLMDEGLKIDDKLKAENATSGPANPQMQSATFNPAA
jgi:hypothetical protein